MWDWYFELSESVLRVVDGVTYTLPPSEFHAWKMLSGRIVYPHEYAIMRAMDRAFVSEMSKEVAAYRERERDRAKHSKE